ncbi:MAG: hypothetical protein NTX91_02390, partial [candidate division SR1 bacterium]|nr:hypothetical protein [candidate division SR1 bacterium]
IGSGNIYMKAGGAATLMSGYANAAIVFTQGITAATYTGIGGPKTYFYKNTTGLTGGVYSTYGDAPWIKVDIPPFQPATAYQATLTFTLTAS